MQAIAGAVKLEEIPRPRTAPGGSSPDAPGEAAGDQINRVLVANKDGLVVVEPRVAVD